MKKTLVVSLILVLTAVTLAVIVKTNKKVIIYPLEEMFI